MQSHNNTNMQIEKNIPIPDTSGRGRKTSYVLPDMEVGESFFVPKETSKYLSKLFYQTKQKGYKLTARTYPDGVRIWRKA